MTRFFPTDGFRIEIVSNIKIPNYECLYNWTIMTQKNLSSKNSAFTKYFHGRNTCLFVVFFTDFSLGLQAAALNVFYDIFTIVLLVSFTVHSDFPVKIMVEVLFLYI